MVIIDNPATFWMGSPETEPSRRDHNEHRHREHIPRSFEIASKETTVAQFLAFKDGYEYDVTDSPGDDHPISQVSWYGAAMFLETM